MEVNLLMETDLATEDDPWCAVKAYVNEEEANEIAKEYTTDRFKYDVITMTVSGSKELYVIGYETAVKDFPAQTLGYSFDCDKINSMFEELDELITAFRSDDFEVCRKNISVYFKSHGFEFVQDPGDQTLMHHDFIPTSLWVDIVKEV